MQHDLFESPIPVVSPVPTRPGPGKLEFLGSLQVPIRFDQIIAILIGLVALYAVIYSLGVERGKRAAGSAAPSVTVSPEATQASPKVMITYGAIKVGPPAEKKAPEEPLRAHPAGSYTIQMATYQTQSAAEKQVSKFIKLGHQAFVVTEGSLRLVCLDGFISRQEASRTLQALKVRRMVPYDAFVRSLPQ